MICWGRVCLHIVHRERGHRKCPLWHSIHYNHQPHPNPCTPIPLPPHPAVLRCPRLRCSLLGLQIEKKYSRNKVLPNYNEGTKEKIRFKSNTFDIDVLVDVLLVVVVEQCRQWEQAPEMMNSWIIWWVRLSQRLIQRKMTNTNTKPINFTGS